MVFNTPTLGVTPRRSFLPPFARRGALHFLSFRAIQCRSSGTSTCDRSPLVPLLQSGAVVLPRLFGVHPDISRATRIARGFATLVSGRPAFPPAAVPPLTRLPQKFCPPISGAQREDPHSSLLSKDRRCDVIFSPHIRATGRVCSKSSNNLGILPFWTLGERDASPTYYGGVFSLSFPFSSPSRGTVFFRYFLASPAR